MCKLKIILLSIITSLCSALCLNATELPDYQLEGAGTGNQGTYLLSVSVLDKKKNLNDELIARCAVHGVLFRGFTDPTSRKTIRPMAGSPTAEGEHADYFEKFFDKGGAAAGYVTFINSSRKITKAGKQHKMTVTVTVSKDQLRHDLEKAGVIKNLNSIF